jgi:membrane associated rhomboid family serine protease
VIASFWSVAAGHIVAFIGGLLLGFVGSNRYRIVRRDQDRV